MGQRGEHYYFKLAQLCGGALMLCWFVFVLFSAVGGTLTAMQWWVSVPFAVVGAVLYVGGRLLQWLYFGGRA